MAVMIFSAFFYAQLVRSLEGITGIKYHYLDTVLAALLTTHNRRQGNHKISMIEDVSFSVAVALTAPA
jgi:hypothetical protein